MTDRPKRSSRERRYDEHGELRLMAEVDGWLMVRRPGRIPFTMRRKEWDVLPADSPPSSSTSMTGIGHTK